MKKNFICILYFLAAFLLCQKYLHAKILEPQLNSSPANAIFTADLETYPMMSVLASVNPHPLDKAYKQVRLHFYAFQLTPADIAAAQTGNINQVDKRIYEPEIYKDYNHSNASLILNLDADNNITQVDMMVPGTTCTVASEQKSLESFSNSYSFDGKQLKMGNEGAYACDVGSRKIQLGWKVDVDVPVYADLN